MSARSVEAELGLARDISTQGDNCFADVNGDGGPELLLMNHGHEDGAQLMVDPGSGAYYRPTSFPQYDYHSCSPADLTATGGWTCTSGPSAARARARPTRSA